MTNETKQTAVDFVPYELALELKELGFDEPCFGIHYYKESYPMLNPQSGETELVFEFGQYIKQTEVATLAPTYSQAFRWFRENHGLNSFVYHYGEDGILVTIYFAYNINDKLYASDFRTHEEAELACLKKLIEIVKNGGNK
jgi:hypothetical protein